MQIWFAFSPFYVDVVPQKRCWMLSFASRPFRHQFSLCNWFKWPSGNRINAEIIFQHQVAFHSFEFERHKNKMMQAKRRGKKHTHNIGSSICIEPSLCHVKIILNTQQAIALFWIHFHLSLSLALSADSLWLSSIFSIHWLCSRPVYRFLIFLYVGLLAINDRCVAGVFLLCLCDSFERRKKHSKNKNEAKRKRHIRWAMLLWYLLMQDIGRPHSQPLKVSLFMYVSRSHTLCRPSCSATFSFFLCIICPLINLLITPWNFICSTHI